MKMPKPTLTVAIAAFNEEKNIRIIIRMLLKQTHFNFKLDKIAVYSDGSTDKTNQYVLAMAKKHQTVKLKFDKNRRGKNFRLNQIFRENRSDFVVVLDADIGILGNGFLESLVTKAQSDHSSQMVVAHQIPLRPEGLVGQLIYASFVNWDNIRLSVPNFDNVHCFYGAATLYKKAFARKLKIPESLNEERLYIFLMAKKQNGFRYCQEAEIVYWPVNTIEDFRKLSRRFFGGQEILDKMFHLDSAGFCKIPTLAKLKGMAKSFMAHPILSPMALLLNLYLSKVQPVGEMKTSPIWEVTDSSKKEMAYE